MTIETSAAPVWLTPPGRRAADGRLRGFAAAAFAVDSDAARAMELARELGASVSGPGEGHTLALFEALATLAAADLTAARVAEAHLDALSILQQAAVDPAWVDPASVDPAGLGRGDEGTGVKTAMSTWGVFAAEGAGVRLDATSAGTASDAGAIERWSLNGTKPWCSLAGSLSHALVTAHTPSGTRRLFAVDLADPGITVHTGAWVGKGLPGVPSGPVDFHSVPARPVGDTGWYLRRPGFAWGAIGVAACWWGGAVGLARQVWESAAGREPDQIALAHLGALDVTLNAAGVALTNAANRIDAGDATGEDGALLAARVRGQVARTVDEVIARTGRALGPAPLAFDARHSQRLADLQLYVRQHHAERDDASLGRRLLDAGVAPW